MSPYRVNIQEGKKYFWCACGLSQNQPFCDGSHKSSDKNPVIFEADSTKEVWLCECKKSKNPPYCDGSHND